MSTNQNKSLAWAHPLVQEWFVQKVGQPTEPQEQGWPSILAGKTTLISAPTGSGKTFAAFLACLDKLIRQALKNSLQDEVEVLYVSPLKALSNDIQKNLLTPLKDIKALAESKGLKMQDIRVAVRTGDTLPAERQAMLKHPPHILITTPESLFILLTAEKSRQMLTTVNTVIVDEIHAVADDKRGTHLALSLERLEALTSKSPVRIGLSATQKPLDKVARFLTGSHTKKPVIVNIGHQRQLDLAVFVPERELGPVASNEMWDEIYEKLAELSSQNRSTLVFVNTRRLAERVAHHLAERIGEDKVAAHHGSLSRKLRLAAETKLKNGELQLLVATASLELGIDIGTVDLVCQIGSPRAIAVTLQRVGRAGHWHGAISKGRLFATTRDELLECAALVYAIRQGDLDELIIPKEPLDILAQQIVAACATQDWDETELFSLLKKAAPYEQLTKAKYEEVITMLSEGIAGSRGRYGAYLHRDKVNHLVKGRKGARLAAITSGGAIPENGLFNVIAEPEGLMVGTIDEDFAVESNRGDIFLLGSTSWRVKRVENGRVLVEDARGAAPSVPFWRGEAPARTIELSLQVSLLRQKLSDLIQENVAKISVLEKTAEVLNALAWIKNECGLDDSGAEQLLEYINEGRKILGLVPTQQNIIAERFFDESGGMQLIIHAPFGARINKAWGLALRKKFCRSFNFELQASATDNGLNIALAEQHSFPLGDVFNFLNAKTVTDVVRQAALQSPIFATRWHAVASRSLALLRFMGGKKVPPNIQRMRSDDLLAAVFPDAAACQDNLGGRDIELPDHPLIEETLKDVLHEAMDIDGLIKVLQGIETKAIRCVAVDTPVPSVFSHEILNANPYAYLDDAPLEERRARAVEMRRILPENMLEEIGKLDPKAIQDVSQQAWPDVRNADELHDLMQTVIALPLAMLALDPADKPRDDEDWRDWKNFFEELVETNRATRATVNDHIFWVAAEKAKSFLSVYPDAVFEHALADVEDDVKSSDETLVSILRGWLLHLGPITAPELSQRLVIDLSSVEQALIKLETTGFILRGQFRQEETLEWCERRLLARIHRYTTERLRREIEPVTSAQFMRWLLKWQHVSPGTQLKGEQGLLEILKQLQGFEIPASAWEDDVLARRIKDYDTQMLDHLCLTGAVGWGRLSAHSTGNIDPENKKLKRLSPTKVAPITFFVREESEWMNTQSQNNITELKRLSHAARAIYEFLQQRGASFFPDIKRNVPHLQAEIETGLWELVATGLITADGFDNLRTLINPRRRHNKRRRRQTVRLHAGRWSLLFADENPADNAQKAEAACWMLLKRYGVVFRDLIVREKNLPRWRELLLAFRRLELRGEIRGGRFVDGFLGEQFALTYAVESLRAMRKQEVEDTQLAISSADPLNLLGIILPGQRVSSASKQLISFKNGLPDQTSIES